MDSKRNVVPHWLGANLVQKIKATQVRHCVIRKNKVRELQLHPFPGFTHTRRSDNLESAHGQNGSVKVQPHLVVVQHHDKRRWAVIFLPTVLAKIAYCTHRMPLANSKLFKLRQSR